MTNRVKKVLLTGCNGLLGQNLTLLKPDSISLMGLGQVPQSLLPLSGYLQVDIASKHELMEAIHTSAPDLILNTAALTNVDLCESELERCLTINALSLSWMAETNIPIMQISTDYVFDGNAGPYRETDKTNPLGSYGRSKLLSEDFLIHSGNISGHKNWVVRTMTLWGWGKNLRPSFVDFVKQNLENKKEIKIVTDQIGNPTLAWDLARGIWSLIEKNKPDLYHYAGRDIMSRYDWAVKIAEHYKLDTSYIKPCLTKDLKQAAPRPLNSGLISDKAASVIGYKPMSMDEQMQKFAEMN